MTTYTLHAKSEISTITSEALAVFLRLSGYSSAMKSIEEEEVLVEFQDLRKAQKAELSIRERFSCYVTAKNEVGNYRIIHVKSFRKTGKWYSEFDVRMPADICEWDIRSYLLSGKSDDMHLLAYQANGVPFIVPAHLKASDIKSYIDLGEK